MVSMSICFLRQQPYEGAGLFRVKNTDNYAPTSYGRRGFLTSPIQCVELIQ